VTEVHCRVAAGAVNMICAPWSAKQAPRDPYEAKFSLPFAVAIALVDGRAGTAEFTLENAQRPLVADLMSRMTFDVAPEYSVKDMPGDVQITLADGRRESSRQPRVRGDRAAPIAREELLNKFYDNLRDTPYRQRADAIAGAVLGLDRLADLEPLASLLRMER